VAALSHMQSLQCCLRERQATCCEPAEKEGCCAPESSACGCQAAQSDVRRPWPAEDSGCDGPRAQVDADLALDAL
jgi:hypothetical protein